MQILNNIISNSIKFTDSGSINIEIGLINKSSEAYRIKFTVHDTGIGIKEEDRGMIFESFTQISSSKHTAFGAGIGLYIVKKLVDYLNGEITLDSVPGKGTSMSVILDFSNATSLNTATPTSSYILKTPHDEDRKESFENILKGKTILIAEDHDFSRLLLIEILKKYGAFTVEAKNGKELLEIFSASSPDLLLIDVHMPEMDGVETCKVIRADKSYDPDIPVILMTADTFLMKTINIIEIGANNIIFKPILEKDLIQVICQCMQLVSGGMVDLIYTTADSVRLDNINNNKLLEEFMILLENISIGAKISDVSMQRDNIHKLKGIAGLAEDDAFYSEVIVLSNYFKKGSHPQYEECINRLKQMVRKKQEEF